MSKLNAGEYLEGEMESNSVEQAAADTVFAVIQALEEQGISGATIRVDKYKIRIDNTEMQEE